MSRYLFAAVLLCSCLAPGIATAYGQSTYYAQDSYYAQGYYQGYYQSYYQGYYQAYYQSYYQAYYQSSYNYATSSFPDAGTYTYSLMCVNTSTQAPTTTTQQLTVSLPSCSTPAPDGSTAGSICPAACIEKAGAATIQPPQTTTLSWCCPSGSTGVTVTNSGSGSTPVNTGGALSGTATVGVGSYALKCTAKGAGTQTITQTPDGSGTQTLIATPARVRKGSATMLSWSTTNMASCSLKDQSTPPNTFSSALTSPGTQVFINQKTTFNLTCTDQYGTTTTFSLTVPLVPGFQR